MTLQHMSGLACFAAGDAGGDWSDTDEPTTTVVPETAAQAAARAAFAEDKAGASCIPCIIRITKKRPFDVAEALHCHTWACLLTSDGTGSWQLAQGQFKAESADRKDTVTRAL